MYCPPKITFLEGNTLIKRAGHIILREANVNLLIPAGGVPEGSVFSLTMMTSKQSNFPSERKTPQLPPFIKFGGEG